RAGITQARLIPNPRLFLQTENWRAWSTPALNGANQTDTYAYLSQPIETGGKRTARTELARSNARRAELERELLERQIIAHIKQAYWNAAGAERIHRAYLENLANFRQIIEYHEVRVREGAMPEADLLRVRLEGERLELAANTAGLDAERARIELFRAMGQTQFTALRLVDELEGPATAPQADTATALANRTEMKLVREARETAAANSAVQRSLARQDVDILLGYKRTSGFSTVLGGLQWNVPLFNRNQGNIEAADVTVRSVESEVAATEAVIRAEVRAADSDLRIRRTQVSGTLQRMLQRADESARIALAAYREGGADLLRLLDAQRVRIELETLYYRTLSEYRQSIVALETAMGVNP
ncbi:MAG TPA: TolC family protein, partial [Bryobacteraceae bacterium]|nr:TolC family protein [Bryobacteraceae bacterium]